MYKPGRIYGRENYTNPLLAGECRFVVVIGERPRAFVVIVGFEQRRKHSSVVFPSLVEVGFDRDVARILHRTDCERGFLDDPSDELLDFGIEVVVGVVVIDNTHIRCAFGGNMLAGHGEFLCKRWAGEAGDVLDAAGPREQPEVDFGKAEVTRLARQPEITGQREIETAPEAVA